MDFLIFSTKVCEKKTDEPEHDIPFKILNGNLISDINQGP